MAKYNQHSRATTNIWHNLQRRTATAVMLIAAAIPVLWVGGWFLTIAMMVVALQMNREWENIIPSSAIGWRIFGLFYIILPILCLLWLRNLSFADSDDTAFWATIYPIAMVAVTDVAAFFVGKIVGGAKLAVTISPNKTWSGLIGGIVATTLISPLFLPLIAWPNSVISAMLLGVAIAILAQIGDLFESWIKRKFAVKDSGTILPGHGGLLDRVDGYMFVLPVYLCLILLNAELLP